MYLLDSWGSSNYRGTCIQGIAEFVDTTDSTVAAAVAELQQSQSPLAETGRPEMRQVNK